jgi:hypothetical protein
MKFDKYSLLGIFDLNNICHASRKISATRRGFIFFSIQFSVHSFHLEQKPINAHLQTLLPETTEGAALSAPVVFLSAPPPSLSAPVHNLSTPALLLILPSRTL